MSDGRIEFEITADGKKAIQEVKQVTESITNEAKKWDSATDAAFDQVGQNAQEATKAIEKETKSWGQSAEKAANDIEGNFANVAKNIAASLSAAAIGKAVLDFGKQAIDAASDLAEVQNVVDVTFGEGASKIESWSKAAGRQFGLTETQAKKFTSTLGAMMKSAGMSGNEIVEMSTDLAGLAADMASFYNLDFETAFEKIRSGISGETEPLKQLGINMSVANLEAFALEKGITKAFNSMSQQEQTMLRYQYLMKATADAQGDFARTSDGFANATRRIETAWDTIKTKIGTALLPGIEDALGQISKVMEALTQTPEETLFDKINAIEIDKQSKLDAIQAIADQANLLIEKLNFVTNIDAGKALESLASGANTLKSSAPGTWQSFFTSLQKIDGLQNLFGEGNKAEENIRGLVTALTSTTFDQTKADAWKTLLETLSANAEGLTKLTGKDAEGVKEWLQGISNAVDSIDPSNVDAWDKMLTTLVSGFAADTPESKEFLNNLAEGFLAMGSDSETGMRGLQALGFTTDQIKTKQSEWLKICQQLTQTIPGLSAVIDQETGAITGGQDALQKYVSEWKATQEKLIYWKAYYAKREALAETQGQLDSMYIEAGGAQVAVDNYLKNHPEINNLYKSGGKQAVQREGGKEGREFFDLWENATEAQNKYQTALEQTQSETQQLANEEQFLNENYSLTEEELAEVSAAYGEAGEAAGEFGGKSADAWKEVTQNVYDSIKALSDYVQGVRDATAQAVNGVVKGFDQVQRPTEEARLKLDKLRAKMEEVGESSKEGQKLKAQIDELQASIDEFSPEKVTSNLQSQMAFMEHYMENLEFMKGRVSDEFLASLADGSTESAEYLSQMVQALQGANAEEAAQQVAQADQLFQEVQAKKEAFTETLTQQKLAVDETYEALVENAKKAIAEMDMSGEAGKNASATVSAIAEGISGGVSEVSSAVNAILGELQRLASFHIDTTWGGFGSLGVIPKHELGLSYVPFNGYLAELHEGEGILTAEENRVWQRFKNGQESSRNVDYDALGGVMRDNITPGGNVYLDGRVVGAVISKAQGESYRALQRSGWQG